MTDIENLKELEAKATPGPWSLVDDGRFLTGPDGYLVADCDYFYQPGTEANTALIVAMRNALPDLLASLASKDAEIAELRKWQERESDTQDALQAIGEEFGVHGGEPRTDGVRRVLTELRARAEAAESRLTTALAALGEAREALDDANARLAPYLNNVLTSDELKLVDKHCDWPSFKCAFNAVMNSRKARATLAKLNALEGNEDD